MGLTVEQERDFTAFVDARGSDLLRTAVLLTGSRHAGEDLLQVVLVKAVRRWPSITGDPGAYLRRVLATTAVDQSRRRRWREVTRSEVPEVPSHETGVVEDRDQVLRALSQLPPRQRAVLVLRYYADLSEAETASQLGISVGTVKSTASRAIAALRTTLPDREELA